MSAAIRVRLACDRCAETFTANMPHAECMTASQMISAAREIAAQYGWANRGVLKVRDECPAHNPRSATSD